MEALKKQLSELWCSLMHESPMWPIHGRYQCRTCLREYPVRWEHETEPQPAAGDSLTWVQVRHGGKQADCPSC